MQLCAFYRCLFNTNSLKLKHYCVFWGKEQWHHDNRNFAPTLETYKVWAVEINSRGPSNLILILICSKSVRCSSSSTIIFTFSNWISEQLPPAHSLPPVLISSNLFFDKQNFHEEIKNRNLMYSRLLCRLLFVSWIFHKVLFYTKRKS